MSEQRDTTEVPVTPAVAAVANELGLDHDDALLEAARALAAMEEPRAFVAEQADLLERESALAEVSD